MAPVGHLAGHLQRCFLGATIAGWQVEKEARLLPKRQETRLGFTATFR